LKRRVLVLIVGQGSITHIIRTGLAERMKDFCEPVIAILWNQEDLIKELRQNNFEVHLIPDISFSAGYVQHRLKINRWYYKEILQTPSTQIQQKYLSQYVALKKKIKKGVTKAVELIGHTIVPGFAEKMIAHEKEMLSREPLYHAYKEWLSALNLQGLFTVTPFLHEVEIMARILDEAKVPLIASIHSFDNITKRGWPGFFFNHYIVWNKYNKKELQRINPALKEKDISITGPPQFDFHFNDQFPESKDEWLNELKLPRDKKIILYSGGSVALFPNEPQYLKHLNDACKHGLIKNAVILFRSHPLDKMERWENYVGKSEFIIYSNAPNGAKKLDFANVTLKDIKRFIATLKYTDLHINFCSTMAVDGSVFDKPQIGPYYDDINPLKQELIRKMYFQEHYLPIMQSKAIHLAHSKEQLIELVNKMLADPDSYNKKCRKCVEEIITCTDGQSTKRVSEILKSFFS